MNPEAFYQALAQQNILLNETQKQQFALYFTLLISANEKVNLTGITARDEVYLKHFYDSLTPSFYLPALQTEPLSICDVGAGAGFPSLPLKIVFPQLQVTIVDSLNKRVAFLNELVAKLNLTGVAIYHERAEDFGNKRSAARESFDLVTARAVAALNVLSEFCLPLVKKGGQFVALKGSHAENELTAANYAITQLGGRLAKDLAFALPEAGGERHLIMIDKVRQTPARYPRRAGSPMKEPLAAKEDF